MYMHQIAHVSDMYNQNYKVAGGSVCVYVYTIHEHEATISELLINC